MLTATPPGRPTVVDVQRLWSQARAHRETGRGFRLACWETDEGVAPPAPVQRAVPEPRPRVTVPCTAAGRKRALWDFRHRKMRRPRRSSTAGGWWERRDNSWALANFLRKSKPASSFLSMTAPLALKCQHKKATSVLRVDIRAPLSVAHRDFNETNLRNARGVKEALGQSFCAKRPRISAWVDRQLSALSKHPSQSIPYKSAARFTDHYGVNQRAE